MPLTHSNLDFERIKKLMKDNEKTRDKLRKNKNKLWKIIERFIKPLLKKQNYKRLKASFYVFFTPSHIPEDLHKMAKKGCITTKHISWIVILLLYILTPIDLIPDWIPVAGWIDDAAVAAKIFSILGDALDCYIKMVESQGYEV